ncbi:MAG TPA: hypothetical protein VHY32_11415 [Caulobacteraceae bacterium]|jgi:hypothetical protein|nr:hypothetical protein [Caulobacteraceae bacterium]
MDTKTYESFGLHLSLTDVDPTRGVNGRANREIQNALSTPADRQYNPGPEAFEDAPRGAVSPYSHKGRSQLSVPDPQHAPKADPGVDAERRQRRRFPALALGAGVLTALAGRISRRLSEGTLIVLARLVRQHDRTRTGWRGSCPWSARTSPAVTDTDGFPTLRTVPARSW